MKVSIDWVIEFGRANVRIAHVAADGTPELLDTECTLTPDRLQFICGGKTRKGFAEFSLLVLADVPANVFARNLEVTPQAVDPGEPVKVLVDVTNDGSQAGSFSTILNVKEPGAADFKPVAVRDITLGGAIRAP